MRLWHYKLVPYLPQLQLVAQWRELNSIFKKQDKHILINYIYNHEWQELFYYSGLVILEMQKRNIKIRSFDNMINFFMRCYPNLFKPENVLNEILSMTKMYKEGKQIPYREHDERYLRQCFFNLQEKYDRGQKDFTKEQYLKLVSFMTSNHIINFTK